MHRPRTPRCDIVHDFSEHVSTQLPVFGGGQELLERVEMDPFQDIEHLGF